MQIRAAIVGLGRWGRALVISMQGKSAELCFVRGHTRTRASAQNFCRAHGIPLVDSYEQILADPEIDAVVLATPHSLHESQIVAAAAAGKYIHVEKPITLDRATADRAIAAARNAGVVLAVGYCRRFHPSVVEVRQRLAQGWLGRVVATATNFSFTLYGSKGLAEISRPNLEALRFVSTSDAPPTGAVLAPPDERHEHAGFDMLSAELTAFARAIRERKPYPVPIEDVLHGMSVFDALVQAARSNQIA